MPRTTAVETSNNPIRFDQRQQHVQYMAHCHYISRRDFFRRFSRRRCIRGGRAALILQALVYEITLK